HRTPGDDSFSQLSVGTNGGCRPERAVEHDIELAARKRLPQLLPELAPRHHDLVRTQVVRQPLECSELDRVGPGAPSAAGTLNELPASERLPVLLRDTDDLAQLRLGEASSAVRTSDDTEIVAQFL